MSDSEHIDSSLENCDSIYSSSYNEGLSDSYHGMNQTGNVKNIPTRSPSSFNIHRIMSWKSSLIVFGVLCLVIIFAMSVFSLFIMFDLRKRNSSGSNEGLSPFYDQLNENSDALSYFSSESQNKDLITGYEVTWDCWSWCDGYHHTFELSDVTRTSAITYFKGWILGKQSPEDCEQDCEEENDTLQNPDDCIECDIIDKENEYTIYNDVKEEKKVAKVKSSGKHEVVRCHGKPTFDFDKIRPFLKMLVKLVVQTADKYPPDSSCYESTKNYGLNEIMQCSDVYFNTAIDFFNDFYSFISKRGRKGISGYVLLGCDVVEADIEELGKVDRCCGGNYNFRWGKSSKKEFFKKRQKYLEQEEEEQS